MTHKPALRKYDQVVLDFLVALAELTPEEIADTLASLGVTSDEAERRMADLAKDIREAGAKAWMDGA